MSCWFAGFSINKKISFVCGYESVWSFLNIILMNIQKPIILMNIQKLYAYLDSVH